YQTLYKPGPPEISFYRRRPTRQHICHRIMEILKEPSAMWHLGSARCGKLAAGVTLAINFYHLRRPKNGKEMGLSF
ncbi:MAG: hypothetical protein Q7U34_15780, partial [Anaerolineales bacterium]|nr:hypothetical protein [Anaerolineales bacterium]